MFRVDENTSLLKCKLMKVYSLDTNSMIEKRKW